MGTEYNKDEFRTQHSRANTPDVTLTFVDWLQKVRCGSWLHLFYDIRALQNMNLWDFGEMGGFYHWYKTQHEKAGYSSHEYPASRNSYTRYYDEEELPLHRPVSPHFAKGKESYPLRHTRHIFTCPNCSGSGRVDCGKCGGDGACSNCQGRGRIKSGQDLKRCFSCGGSRDCSRCGGSGKVTCGRCKGERKLLQYISKDYKWWFDEDEEPILSEIVDRFRVRGLIKKTRQKGGSVEVSEFSVEEVLRTTGVLNDRIGELILLANTRRRKLEQEIANRSDLVVFQDNQREYIPLSYINMFADTKYGQYFVAGTEQHREVRRPPMPFSVLKGLSWLGLVSTAISIGILHSYRILDTWALITLLSFASGLLGIGVWRVSQEELKEPMPTQWFIFDESGHGAWQFAYLLAQAVSRARVAYISDTWFTELLEPPKPDSVKSRNSFMYTIRHGQSNASQQTEIIMVGNRAQEQYPQDVARIVQSAARLIWIAGRRTVEELDRAIAETLVHLPEETRKVVEVCVICDERTTSIALEQFSRVWEKLNRAQFSMLTIPMQQMCSETQSGFVSEKVDGDFQRLIEYSGFRVALSRLELYHQQIKLELPLEDVSSLCVDNENQAQHSVVQKHSQEV